MFCGNCANPIKEGKNFCSKDGSPLGQGTKFCIRCAKPLKPGARFCPGCGFQVGSYLDKPTAAPGLCTNCQTQNEAGKTTCIICGEQLKNPLPPIKQPAPAKIYIREPTKTPSGARTGNTSNTSTSGQHTQPSPSTTETPSPTNGQAGNQTVKRYSSIVDGKRRATIPKQVGELLKVETGGTVVFSVAADGTVTFTASKRRKAGKNGS